MARLGCDRDNNRTPGAPPYCSGASCEIVNTLATSADLNVGVMLIPYRDIIHITVAIRADHDMRRDLVIVVCRNCCRGDDDAHHEDHAHKAHQPTKL